MGEEEGEQITTTMSKSPSLLERVRAVKVWAYSGLRNYLRDQLKQDTRKSFNHSELLRRVTAAGIQARFPNLEVVINETTGDFVGRTGMPAWAAAATKNNRIELQPLPLLKRRRILETTLRHELVHVLVDSIGGGQTPRWLAEGMAVHLAGEGKMMERHQQNNSLSVETVEQALASAKSAEEMRSAYAAAYKLVKEIVQSEGEAKVWKRVAERRYSVNRRVPSLIA